MLRRLALVPILLLVALGSTGWLYLVHAGGLPGPRVSEALPLDELAKHASVPLPWFALVWIAAALLLGLAARWAGLERLVASFVFATGTLFVLYLLTGTSIAVTRQVPARLALHVTGHLESVFLPAAIVGLAAALIANPHRGGRRAPTLVATVVTAGATLQLVHSILPGEHDGFVSRLALDSVGPFARAAGVFAAVALLCASRGLARRRRRAWDVAVAVAALSTATHVLRGLNPGTLVAAAILILLVARRHDFDRPGDQETRYLIATRAATAVVAIAVWGTSALWINRLEADQPFTFPFAGREIASAMLGLHLRGSPHLVGSFGQWFPLSMFLLGIGATAWIVAGWLAPWRHRVLQGVRERAQVEQLVRLFGTDTLAPFTLRQDKSYFIGADGSAFVAYRVVGGVAIVSGDPIGAPEAFGPLIARFIEHAHQRDWRVAILGASERLLPLYRTHGLNVLYHGDEAVVDTLEFGLEGRAIRKVRQSVNRLEKAGFRVQILRPSEIEPGLRDELEAIASSWRGGQPERGFAMALDALFGLDDENAVFVVGSDGSGRPRGFLHFAIAHAGSALSLSSMPRLRATTPNGFNEWLICETVAWAREQGYRHVSLNFSPFAALLDGEAELTVSQELQRRMLLTVKGHFQLDNLLAFNRKFFPRWQQRFIVYERRLDLPRVGIATLAAEAYLPFQTGRR